MTTASRTVFVVEDDAAARSSLAALIESKGIHVRTFESAEDLMDRYVERLDRGSSSAGSSSAGSSSAGSSSAGAGLTESGEEPSCFVFDLRMTGMSGVELQVELARCGIVTPVIIITAFGTVKTAVEAMENGAVTFLEKPCPASVLMNHIDQAFELHERQRTTRIHADEARRRLDTLTPSERDVLPYLVEGQPNKLIAKALSIGLRTVELRRAEVFRKFGVINVAQLVRLLFDGSLLAPRGDSPRAQLGPVTAAADDSAADS